MVSEWTGGRAYGLHCMVSWAPVVFLPVEIIVKPALRGRIFGLIIE